MHEGRVKNPKYNFKLPAYVAMAVGLNLSKSEFQEVIKKAGLCLVDGDEVHDAYSIILTLMQGCRKKMRGYYKASNPM